MPEAVKQDIYSSLAKWMLLLLCFAYPVQAFISIILKVDSTGINMSFRILYLMMAFFLLVVSFAHNGWVNTIPFVAFICFWILYGGRLIYDQNIKDIRFLDKEPFYVYSFAFGNCFIPALALFKNSGLLRFSKLPTGLFWILLLSNVCIIINFLFLPDKSLIELLSVRVGWGEVQMINPITISLNGALLAIVSVSILLFKSEKISAAFRILIFASIFFGLLNLVLGASRGPLLGFLLVCAFITFFYWKYKKFSGKIFLYSLAVYSVFFVLVFIYAIKGASSQKIYLVERVSKDNESIEKEEREYEWSSALRQFSSNPILGDSFVNKFDKSYSHNLFLDSLMATGILGTFFLVIFFVYTLKRLFFILSNAGDYLEYISLGFVFLCTFFVDMVSGGLFVAITFWSLSSFFCAVPLNTKKVATAN